MEPERRAALLADPTLRRTLLRVIRARVPGTEAEDIVQATLVDAIEADRAPADAVEFRRWVFGIARHKVADHHRRAARVELVGEPPGLEATGEIDDAQDLVRWVEAALPPGVEAQQTLEWMAREADGDKLESIAAEANLPAPRVRQRVSRLRRLLRERWAAALALTSLLVAAGVSTWVTIERRAPAPRASSAPESTPLDRARAMREAALERCRDEAWQQCLDGLDEARAIDPAGDQAEVIQEARAVAARSLAAPTPPPASAFPSIAAPKSIPSSAPAPTSKPTAKPGSDAPLKPSAPRRPRTDKDGRPVETFTGESQK